VTPAGFRRRRPVQGYSHSSGGGGRRSLLGPDGQARLETLAWEMLGWEFRQLSFLVVSKGDAATGATSRQLTAVFDH
jgi:hypothetical protein